VLSNGSLQATYPSACVFWWVSAQTASSVRLVIPSFLKIRFKYSLMVPSVRCRSYAISLFSLACETRLTTCLSRKLSFGLRGLFPSWTLRQLEHILFPPSRRNSFPHRKQFRRDTCLNSRVLTNWYAPIELYGIYKQILSFISSDKF
jgi:hypothetical protein